MAQEKDWDFIAEKANELIDSGRSAEEVRQYLVRMGTTEEELRTVRSQTNPPPPPDLYRGNTAEAARSFARGATFGLSDPVEAGIRAAMGEGDFDVNRRALKTASEKAPVGVRLPAELVGGFMTGAGLLRAIPALGRAKTAATAMRDDVAIGAAGGAIQGASDIDSSALEGGTFGAVGGAVLTPVMKAGGKGVEWVMRKTSPAYVTQRAADQGTKMFAEGLAMDSQGKRSMLARAKEMAWPEEVSPLDIAGPSSNIAGMFGAAVRPRFPGRADIREGVKAKLETQRGRIAPELLTAAETEKQGTKEVRDQIIARLREQSDPAYRQAYLEGDRPVDTPAIQEFLSIPWVQKRFLPTVIADMEDTRRKLPFNYRLEQFYDPMTMEHKNRVIPEGHMNIEGFDQLKKAASGFIASAKNKEIGTSGREKDLATIYERDLNAALAGLDADPRFKAYAVARKTYGDEVQNLKTFDKASEFMSDSADNVRYEYNKLPSERDKKIYKDLAINQVVLDMQRKSLTSAAPYHKLEGVEEIQQKLAVLLGGMKQADEFLKKVEQVNASNTAVTQLQGSPTAERFAQELSGGSGASRSAAGGAAMGRADAVVQQGIGEWILAGNKLPAPPALRQIAELSTAAGPTPAGTTTGLEGVFRRIAQVRAAELERKRNLSRAATVTNPALTLPVGTGVGSAVGWGAGLLNDRFGGGSLDRQQR